MSILIRCSKCNTYYGIKNASCKKCGHTDKRKSYYVQHSATNNGKRTNEYVGDSLVIAREIDAERRKQKRTGHIEHYQRKDDISFNELAELFETNFRNKKQDYDNINYIVRHFKNWFGDRSIRTIKAIEIESAHSEGCRGKSTSSYNNFLTVIKRMFNFAIDSGYLVNSQVKIQKDNTDTTRMVFLTLEQEKRLLDVCKKSKSKHLYEMVYIALYTGMREGEIKQLQKEHIRDGFIYLSGNKTKTKQGRQIPLFDSLAEFFKTATFDYNHDIKRAWNTARTNAGLKYFRFHDLRHSYASRLAQNNINLYTISKILGHKSIKTTERYAHLSNKTLLDAANTLEVLNV